MKALNDLILTVRDGESMMLVGPSGCGKSTALRSIAGLEEIAGGTISIGGRVISGRTCRGPGALSGGQRQRVEIGRAIVREPAAFLMDESLSNLDAKSGSPCGPRSTSWRSGLAPRPCT